MTVYFIGAGPGDPDLITVKGARLVEQSPCVIYAGSLVPRAVIERARDDAQVHNSAGLDLDQIIELMQQADERGEDVARVHTGDPAIYGSIAEQGRRLDALGIEWQVIPGVSSFLAASAALKQELTIPEVSQTVIITRLAGRTPVPELEEIKGLARHHATMCIFLSVGMIEQLIDELLKVYPANYPIAIVEKASWPEQRILRGQLDNIVPQVQEAEIRATAMILVGQVLDCPEFNDSLLYAPTFSHGFRTARINPEK